MSSEQLEQIDDARGDVFDAFAHDVAEKQMLQRAAMAMGYGLNPNAVTRHTPREKPSNNTTTSTTTNNSRGSLLGVALGVGSTLLAGGLGLGAFNLIASMAEPTGKPETKIEKVVEPGEKWDFNIEPELIEPAP